MIIVSALLLFAPSAAGADDHFVRILVRPDKQHFHANEFGRLTYSFALAPAIKLNHTPPIRLTIVDGADLEFNTTELSSSALSEEEIELILQRVGLIPTADIYFKELPAITASFHVPTGAPPGIRQVSTELQYYFCSMRLGVCTRTKKTISTRVTIGARAGNR